MQCCKCQKELKLVPAGVSKKTGKPYDAFYSCDRECGTTAKYEQVYAPPETAPEDKIQEMAEKIANIETILIGEGVSAKARETAIGNLALAIDGLGERLDGIGEWIKANIK